MQKKLKLVVITLCCSSFVYAQTPDIPEEQKANSLNESAFTFTEAQLGEDDDMSQNVTILNSNTNVYASQVGFQFSPARFRYRAFNQKYNDVYINGALVKTINSESTEVEDIKKTLADLGLEGVENINYLQAIKRVIGMSDKPLANE